MDDKEPTTWREEAALERFQIIAPLLDSNLDRDKQVQLRKKLAKQNNLSVKTLRRYESAWLKGGFAGLKPAERPGCSRLPKNFEQLMQEAIALKREVPTRSVQ